ncbi:hypothetical protein NMYAN_110059 [Nitrosomonas nitrosa]|uniref:Uncharacterized protein n=1 Tax=Nitrosomonas nitrosa TaxID=52442 RepID=A0A8H8YX19_9PROT|nr:hypothetical protein NMYAN_110059 [Nitrosomonas nitrosa]
MQTLMLALQRMQTQRGVIGVGFQQLQRFDVGLPERRMPFQEPDFLAFVLFGEH